MLTDSPGSTPPPGSAQRLLSVLCTSKMWPASLRTTAVTEGTMLFAGGAAGSLKWSTRAMSGSCHCRSLARVRLLRRRPHPVETRRIRGEHSASWHVVQVQHGVGGSCRPVYVLVD